MHPAGAHGSRRGPGERLPWSPGASQRHSRLVGELAATLVGHRPSPDLLALAARDDAGLVDRGDDRSIPGEQRLGRAHLGASGQLALGDAVAAVFAEFLDGMVLLRAYGAVGALVHLAAQAEGSRLRELRRAERARVEAIAAADAQVLVVQDDLVLRAIEAVDRAHRHAGSVGAVHARDRDRALAGEPVVHRHQAPAVHAPGNFVLLLSTRRTAVALDAALGVTDEFHSGHGLLLVSRQARSTLQRVVLVSCIIVTES